MAVSDSDEEPYNWSMCTCGLHSPSLRKRANPAWWFSSNWPPCAIDGDDVVYPEQPKPRKKAMKIKVEDKKSMKVMTVKAKGHEEGMKKAKVPDQPQPKKRPVPLNKAMQKARPRTSSSSRGT